MKCSTWVWGALTTLMLAGCASRPSENEMNHLASSLTKVTAAVDANVRYRHPPEDMDSVELLRSATEHDSSLLQPFSSYTLLARREGRQSVVLLCDPRTGAALLEDSGCTPHLDVHRWQSPILEQCEFSLDLGKICTR